MKTFASSFLGLFSALVVIGFANGEERTAKQWMELYQAAMEGPAKITSVVNGQSIVLVTFKEKGEQVTRIDIGGPLNMTNFTIGQRPLIWYRDAGKIIDLSAISKEMGKDSQPFLQKVDSSFDENEYVISSEMFDGKKCTCVKREVPPKTVEAMVSIMSKALKTDAKDRIATTQFYFFDTAKAEIVGSRELNYEKKVLSESIYIKYETLSERECATYRIPTNVPVLKPSNMGELTQLMIGLVGKP